MNFATDFPSLLTLEKATTELGPLTDDLLFVGGATIGFYLVELGTRIHRETMDIDVVVEATTRFDLASVEKRMRELGFHEDIESRVICRWRKGDLIVDLMPTGEGALGFKNRWYEPAFQDPFKVKLGSGRSIRIPNAPHALACKTEAFLDRGYGDFQASSDFEDIVAILDCRPELLDEVESSSGKTKLYLAGICQDWLQSLDAIQGIAAHLGPDAASQARRGLILERIQAIAQLA